MAKNSRLGGNIVTKLGQIATNRHLERSPFVTGGWGKMCDRGMG